VGRWALFDCCIGADDTVLVKGSAGRPSGRGRAEEFTYEDVSRWWVALYGRVTDAVGAGESSAGALAWDSRRRYSVRPLLLQVYHGEAVARQSRRGHAEPYYCTLCAPHVVRGR
jgi:hypothetical protein